MHTIQLVATDALKPNARNVRTHSKKQIRQIANSIRAFGFTVPVLIDENAILSPGTVDLRLRNFSALARCRR